MGKSLALWCGRDPSHPRSGPRIWATAALPRQNLWIDTGFAESAGVCSFRLRRFLPRPANAGFGGRAPRRREGA